MRRWRGIMVLPILALPACLTAQAARRVAVHADARVGASSAGRFAGLTHGAGATLVWRRALRRMDLRAEWGVQRGRADNGEDGSPCGFFASLPCARIESDARLTTVGLSVGRPTRRGVSGVLGEQRSYLFGGVALLAGRITDDIGPTEAGCTAFFVCVDAQPARTERHRIRRPALTAGGGFDARARGVNWFADIRGTAAVGRPVRAVTLGVGVRF